MGIKFIEFLQTLLLYTINSTMLRMFIRNQVFFRNSKPQLGQIVKRNVQRPLFRTIATTSSLPLFMYLNHHVYCSPLKQEEEK